MLSTADAVRREAYRAILHVPFARDILTVRARRIPVLGTALALVTGVVALRFPLISLWLGAAVLGVPHVVSEIRHTAILRRLSLPTFACCVAVFAVNVLGLAGVTPWWSWWLLSLALAGTVASELFATRSRSLAVLLILPLGASVILLARRPAESLVVLTHVHAFGSIAYFVLAARKRNIRTWPMLLAAGSLLALGLSGALDSLMPDNPLVPGRAAESIFNEVQGTAFAWVGPLWLKRMVFVYAFGQSLHYVIWIHLIPDLDRRSEVAKPLRAKWAAARADFGWPFLPLLVATGIGIVLLLFGGSSARQAYFSLVFFHFALELGALTRQLSPTASGGAAERAKPALQGGG